MQNKCFNCKWFFSCKKAAPEIKNCEYFIPSERKFLDDKRRFQK